ncbi:hypothetical protein PUNSTDRAFT_129934 [Punctularia strigosozonata HHB-11173 SS5]|uniref:uncharacterized protein n=1 Tax=Punctularia strigosozonata (strain HHB-11173) TaxID=741275 RepID=UPI0004417362|nr:uncharacterized protein PUNSTDRAFT_129934 [Punctularia strigosozonata HHB-11173 SS5]EIN14298.1 hypothetical protein PUNSTDRAFT_129934 [Punctularia strigosozonata HHB-11173 SS5]
MAGPWPVSRTASSSSSSSQESTTLSNIASASSLPATRSATPSSSASSPVGRVKRSITGDILVMTWSRPKDVPEYIHYTDEGRKAYCNVCQKQIRMEVHWWKDTGVGAHLGRWRHRTNERHWLAKEDIRKAQQAWAAKGVSDHKNPTYLQRAA